VNTVGGRWGKNRSQESGVRSQNEEHLLSADCLLHLRGARWSGLFARMADLDNMSPPSGKEETSNFKKRRSKAGMSMKTKGRLSTGGSMAGML
jgi:hypothetical protein